MQMLSGMIRRLLGAGGARVPERVEARIRESQEESEILIGWVQLAGVSIFVIF